MDNRKGERAMQARTILVMCPTGTFDNGAEKAMYHLMKLLVQRGHRVIAIAPKQPKQQAYRQLLEDSGITLYTIAVLNWWWEEADTRKIGSLRMRQVEYKTLVDTIAQVMAKEMVDVVLTNSVNVPHGALAAKQVEVPHFWLIHEFPHGEFAYYKEKYEVLKELSRELFAVAGNLQTYLKNDGVMCHAFVPYTTVDKTLLPAVSTKRLVQVGFISERKNQMALLALKRQLPEELPLVFIGNWNSAYKQICDEYIATHQLKNVHFLGHVDNPWTLVHKSDICVFPSRQETFGLVYVEATLLGLNCVLSNNAGHLSAYEWFQNGQMYQLDNPEDLYVKVNNALNGYQSLGHDRPIYTPETAYASIVSCVEMCDKRVAKVKRLEINLLERLYAVVNTCVAQGVYFGKWLKQIWGK